MSGSSISGQRLKDMLCYYALKSASAVAADDRIVFGDTYAALSELWDFRTAAPTPEKPQQESEER